MSFLLYLVFLQMLESGVETRLLSVETEQLSVETELLTVKIELLSVEIELLSVETELPSVETELLSVWLGSLRGGHYDTLSLFQSPSREGYSLGAPKDVTLP